MAKPFWTKTKYLQKIEENRAIIVSVKSSTGDSKNLQVLGAGLVNRPLAQSYATLKDFSRWKEMSEYIKASEYDPKTKVLKLHLEAFNYYTHMNLRVFFDEKESEMKALRFLSLDGPFKDLKGLLEFKDHGRRKTLVSMTVYDEFESLPLPAFFIEFGLEVVFQKIAERMRSFIESEQASAN